MCPMLTLFWISLNPKTRLKTKNPQESNNNDYGNQSNLPLPLNSVIVLIIEWYMLPNTDKLIIQICDPQVPISLSRLDCPLSSIQQKEVLQKYRVLPLCHVRSRLSRKLKFDRFTGLLIYLHLGYSKPNSPHLQDGSVLHYKQSDLRNVPVV